MLYFNANLCLFFTSVYFFYNFRRKMFASCWGGGNDVLALLYFVKICGLYVRKRGVCGYGYIHGYPWIYP